MSEQGEGNTSSTENTVGNSSATQSNNTKQTSGGADGNTESNEPRIPKHRFDEVSRRMKEAEQTLQQLEQEREQAEEAKANEKGEFQKIADKWKTKAEKLEQENKQIKADWTRERRLNVWNNAAQGIVRSEAIMDAFSFLSDTELDSIDDTDPEAYKPLAQNLVDTKPYLGTDGPRGAGSGGSRTPVESFANGGVTRDRSSLYANKNKRRQWK